MAEWLVHSASVLLLKIRDRVRIRCSPGSCDKLYQAHKSDCMFDELRLNFSLSVLLIIVIFFFFKVSVYLRSLFFSALF